MIKEFLYRKIPTPIAIGIIIFLVVLVGGYTWWQYSVILEEETNVPNVKISDRKEAVIEGCIIDDDCLIFGEDEDCNCGCFNKKHDWEAEGACFCAAPVSCECIEGKCEGVFN
jgi:hypothetical protein